MAKRIIVFTTKDKAVETNLHNLEIWLQNCGYPINVIKKGIHNAKLQGPAPPKSNEKVIPLISTYYSNYDNSNVLEIAKQLISNSKNVRIQNAFKNVKFIHAYKQPPNILRNISNSTFISGNDEKPKGLFKCKDKRCKICRLYITEGSSFVTSNGTIWLIKCYASCNSRNALYYLKCKFCKEVSYTGKTDNLRQRTNQHISDCRYNTGGNFDHHIYACAKNNRIEMSEPFFDLNVFMILKDYNKLLDYEAKLHSQEHDTMNR